MISKNTQRKSIKTRSKRQGNSQAQYGVMGIRRLPSLPPPYVPNKQYKFMRRYVTTQASTGTSFTITDICGSLIMAATTTLGYSPFEAVRIKRVRMWGPVTTIGTPVTISIAPQAVETTVNCYADVPSIMSDTTLTIDRPAYIEYVPRLTEPSGSWHRVTATSITLFNLAYPAGATLDVEYEGMFDLTGGPTGFTATLVAATVGSMYSRVVATNFAPVSVNTL